MTKITDSFKDAYDRAPFNERTAIREEIMAALGITSLVAWRNRMYGKIKHTRQDALAIEEIFNKHGVSNIWG